MGVKVSYATLMVRITDTPLTGPPTVITVTDQDAIGGTDAAPDNSGIPGLLTASFSTPNFFLSRTLGTSKPYPPNSNVLADLYIQQLAVSSVNGGTLTIEITDNDFVLDGDPFGYLTAGIAGRLGANPLNTLMADYYYNTSNQLFDTAGATAVSSSVFSGGYGFGQGLGRVEVSGINQPFSVTQVITIQLEPNYQIMSFDSALRVVPEPGILFLMGLGIIAVLRSRS
ncbi:PEP-CTERM protein-sorting domain-containing protein [Nitrosomonas sp. Nm51]|uniref:PEP-CTERM sorting domain-containing protein n=1 Tax=Nitrosomonas sp. Nm51 TaxID=133720 RepID=UPI0008C979E2|nr:PEP-CTERM sorting domain-containing protein [Nitrosomonas sp. Nm51]SER77214.1 PEP-CTERM protein-sorting domain-containing protein [Nitrosomonas sp. Nm51]